MTRTTKQIKRMISKIHPTKEEVEKMSEYEWGFLVLPVKSFNLGRLDALKEEVEFLRNWRCKLNLWIAGLKLKDERIDKFIETIDICEDKINFLQEEIKLIEKGI